MQKVYDLVERVAETDATVLITGESGTGKELVARRSTQRSPRADGPFVAINCAAMPETLLESELFGHAKGAFTDARDGARRASSSKATGGTLFLDEIGEMPLGMQAKLLRALQERTVRPVGGDAEVPFDVRIVAATNRDLETEVEEKRFREDLFYRINVVHIARAAAARARRRRAAPRAALPRAFAGASGRRVVGFRAPRPRSCSSYPWPGNVRELQNCIERAVALAQFDHIGVDDLPERIVRLDGHTRASTDDGDPAAILPMDEVERRYIGQVLVAWTGTRPRGAGPRHRPPDAVSQARTLGHCGAYEDEQAIARHAGAAGEEQRHAYE